MLAKVENFIESELKCGQSNTVKSIAAAADPKDDFRNISKKEWI